MSTADAVVTIAAYGTVTNDPTDGTSYSGPTGTPGANNILVAFVSATGTVAAATMTGGSLSWTRETQVVYNTTSTLYMFWAKTGASPGATTLLFDCTADSATGANIAAFQVSGADIVTANPIKQFGTSSAAGANPAVTMGAAFTVTNGGVGAFSATRNPPGSTPPTLWSQITDSGHSSPTDGIAAFYVIGETASTITATSASTTYGMIVGEVYASGAGPAAASSHSFGALGVGN